MGMRQRRRRVIALTAAGVLGVFAVLPHPLEHLAQFIATGVLIAIAAVAGALLAPRVGLVTPIIDAALSTVAPSAPPAIDPATTTAARARRGRFMGLLLSSQ